MGTGSWNSHPQLMPGKWHHVAITYDGLNLRFYINGVLSLAASPP
ncbi:MAG TPA: LamG-like jellyroll fold domain-containing protein [Archangium sp.]|nr:LamG-like jellyroll fold domain-containing protein [Archangium sp.]